MKKFNIVFLNLEESKIKITKKALENLIKYAESVNDVFGDCTLFRRPDRKENCKYVYPYNNKWMCLDEFEIIQ